MTQVRSPDRYYDKTRTLSNTHFCGDYTGQSEHPKAYYSLKRARRDLMYIANGSRLVGPLVQELHEEIDSYFFEWAIFSYKKGSKLWVFEADYFRPAAHTENGTVEDSGVVVGRVHSYGKYGPYNWTSDFKVDFLSSDEDGPTVDDAMIVASKTQKSNRNGHR